MRSIFEDEGNMKALGMKKIKTMYHVTINEPGKIITSDKDKFLTLKSLLIQNSLKFNTEKICI